MKVDENMSIQHFIPDLDSSRGQGLTREAEAFLIETVQQLDALGSLRELTELLTA